MAKWFINMKKADFNGIARKYGVSTVIARIMRNREVRTDEEINLYLILLIFCRKDWNWQVRMWIQIFRTGSKMAMV